MQDLDIESSELDELVTLRLAYLIMNEFLIQHWDGCMEIPLGAILGELSLWDLESGSKAPMDSSILSSFIKSAQIVISQESTEIGYTGADIQFEHDKNSKT